MDTIHLRKTKIHLPPMELMVVWLEQIFHIPMAEVFIIFMWSVFALSYLGWKNTIKNLGVWANG